MAAFADAIRGGVFLSTLPARGATNVRCLLVLFGHISIHAPREGSDSVPRHNKRFRNISIHAPREGSDSGRAAMTKE